MKSILLIAGGIFATGTLSAIDSFDAGPIHREVQGKASRSPARPSEPVRKGAHVTLKRGEILDVFYASTRDNPEMAFYLPPEGVCIVQVVVERKGSRVTYFLKALKPGKTVGGVVERRWLDRAGFQPRNAADEARIQIAVKARPLHIEVR